MVHFSGYYAWLKEPFSQHAQEDIRQTDLIQQVWTDSGKVNGYRKLHDDLLDQCEICSKNRVARLPNLAGITGLCCRNWVKDVLPLTPECGPDTAAH